MVAQPLSSLPLHLLCCWLLFLLITSGSHLLLWRSRVFVFFEYIYIHLSLILGTFSSGQENLRTIYYSRLEASPHSDLSGWEEKLLDWFEGCGSFIQSKIAITSACILVKWNEFLYHSYLFLSSFLLLLSFLSLNKISNNQATCQNTLSFKYKYHYKCFSCCFLYCV